MIKYILLLSSIFVHTFMVAQNYKLCGTDQMMQQAIENEPTLLDHINLLKQKADSISKTGLLYRNSNTTYTIPIVIHVIHTGGSNNISDDQIHDAIRIVNEDFNKLNSDTSQIINEFTDIVANVGIEFKLAQLDPDGVCTKGITRTYSELTYDAGENVKELVKWDTKKYLNVWVVSNIASGAGGYSYNPGYAPNADANAGVVILASQFGSIGASNGGNFSSRSLTHEIGHYLDLPHTWGGTNDNYLEENCDIDDYIDDTPNTIGSNLGCNLSQTSCGSLDNVQNFMDYSSCAKMYTVGQRHRMRTAIETGTFGAAARYNLTTEENLTATGVHENYNGPDCIAIIDFKSESSVTCTGNTVEWENLSTNYDEALSYLWTFEGGTPATSNQENPTITYNLPGSFDVSLEITTTGGTNSKTIESGIFVHDVFNTMNAPNTIHFNQNDLNDWYIEEYFEGQTWSWNNLGSNNSSGSIRIRSSDFNEQGPRRAYTPVFDLSGVSPPCYMYYDYAYAIKSSESNDQLTIKITDDCGEVWTLRANESSDELATIASNQFFSFSPTAAVWEEKRISLNPWAGSSQVQAVFEFSGVEGQFLYIDNIRFGVPNLNIDEFTITNINLETFPNPSTGDIKIQFNLINPKKVEFELFNVLGEKISSLEDKYISGQHQLDLSLLKSNLQPGMYFINCLVGDYKETKQIVIY